ncbi:hypothetical protein PGQ11_009249 [Apiospora arundinis]|uniref:Uncharacterized protein n=1 Tax=Apiospora arundinis TaxID=335852 RepID=A0ABR2IHM2_9PEZI
MIIKQCRSTDPRDVVFGLSGPLGGGIVPGYTKEIVDVFRKCVVAAFRNGTYDNLFFTAGLIREGRDISVFPSWVPRFHTLREDIHYAISARSSSIFWTKDINCPETPQILDERTMRINCLRIDRCALYKSPRGPLRRTDQRIGYSRRPSSGRIVLNQLHRNLRVSALLQAAVPDANNEAAVKKWQSYGYTSLEEAKTALEDAFVGPQAPEMPVAYSDSFKYVHPMMDCILRWIH